MRGSLTLLLVLTPGSVDVFTGDIDLLFSSEQPFNTLMGSEARRRIYLEVLISRYLSAYNEDGKFPSHFVTSKQL